MTAITNKTAILDENACKKALEAVSDPDAKFKVFDQLTDYGLTSFAFTVLNQMGVDTQIAAHSDKPSFALNPVYVDQVQQITKSCKQLSETLMASLGTDGKDRLWSVCPHIDTYIDSKIFQALQKIVLSKNFAASSAHPNHPIYPLHQLMWEYQINNHGKYCGCYKHIQDHLSGGAVNTSSLQKSATCITVKYDAGYANKIFIRGKGPGLSWDKGVELKNTGKDTWVFETQGDFSSLEYKILLNDDKWEEGANHEINPGKKQEVSPKF